MVTPSSVCRGFFSRKLVGDGAARVFAHHAQLARLRHVIDLQHQAVDLEGQVIPPRFPIGQVPE